jgi:hypothetical protein
MDVIIDGDSDFGFTEAPEDVFSAFVAVAEHLRDQGRAILSIHADGQEIGADELQERFEGEALDAVTTLTVTTGDIRALVNDSLDLLEKAVPDLPGACRALALVFHGEAPDQGFEPFNQLAEIWSEVKLRELQVAQALDLSLDSVELEGKSLEYVHEELNRYLGEAVAALENQDTVLIGDLLEYELAPRAELEAQIVSLLRDRAQQQAG